MSMVKPVKMPSVGVKATFSLSRLLRPALINNETSEEVDSFKHSGLTLDNKVSSEQPTKSHQRPSII